MEYIGSIKHQLFDYRQNRAELLATAKKKGRKYEILAAQALRESDRIYGPATRFGS